MTKEEIKAIIAQKIEGQGTNLDAASVLPTILNWIIDSAEGGLPKDSLIDVGERPGSGFKEIDLELSSKITSRGLLLKTGSDYYPRTSDYLVDNGQIVSSAVEALDDPNFRPEEIYCVFGTVSWTYEKEVGGASLIVHFTYYGSDQELHYGLLWVDM